MNEIVYIEETVLAQRGPVEPSESVEVPTFLRAKSSVAVWTEGHTDFGCDQVFVFPAWVQGRRAWLIQKQWCAAHGYCACGTSESIVGFEEGAKLLLDHGMFNFPFPESEDDDDQD